MSLIKTAKVESGGASEIIFNNIPQDSTDLLVSYSLRSDPDSSAIIEINGDNDSNNYVGLAQYGAVNPGSPWWSGGYTNTLAYSVPNSYTANTFSSFETYIFNYSGTNPKRMVGHGGRGPLSGQGYVISTISTFWSGTAPITSLRFYTGNESVWMEHSQISLYRIASGSDGTTAVS